MSSGVMVDCYIGLGSNLAEPLQQLNLARKKIAALALTRLQKSSSIYQSAAFTLDDEPQNDYLNAVLKIQTELNPEQLLDALQQLENEQDRVREKRWGARTLDLDILLYGDQKIETARLTVPHIEMQNRNFVLLPLQEISLQIKIPGNVAIEKLIENNRNQVLQKVKEFNGTA